MLNRGRPLSTDEVKFTGDPVNTQNTDRRCVLSVVVKVLRVHSEESS